MILTLSFISERFAKYNKEYFGGKLETPEFEISHTKSSLGQYVCKRGLFGGLEKSLIRISDKFDRSELDYCNTLIHEMIHLHIRQNNIVDTSIHHGRVFKEIANRINRQGGWHIAVTDSVEGCGLTDKSKVNEYYIACYFSGNKKRYFSFCINEKYLDYYKSMFARLPEQFQNLFIFVSDDDNKYANYTKCYKRVRGRFISKNDYESLKKNENVIFSLQTLGIKHKVA